QTGVPNPSSFSSPPRPSSAMDCLFTSSIARIPTSPASNHLGVSLRGSAMGRPMLWRLRLPRSPRTTGVVCMAEPYLITKLDSAERTWKELSVKLADPDVVSKPNEYQKIAQSMAELDEVVSAYQKFKECEKQIEETKGK
ncbi:hypothetical protein Taro_003850, partial [Colocasia esculenta]|nr:hypothetical protein [Colocasia esculenta]